MDGVAALRLVHRDLARAATEGVPAAGQPVGKRREHLAAPVGRPFVDAEAVQHRLPVQHALPQGGADLRDHCLVITRQEAVLRTRGWGAGHGVEPPADASTAVIGFVISSNDFPSALIP